MLTADFLGTYQKTLARLGRRLGPKDGCSEREIARAETHLGVRLPGVLRGFYLHAGRLANFNDTHDRLIPLQQLRIVNKALLFYEENQCGLFWGIRLRDVDHEDPPVVQAENQPKLVWKAFQDCLSSFLNMMLYWQSANGALPYGGVGTLGKRDMRKIEKGWPLILAFEALRVFSRDGQVICLVGKEDIHAAARSSAQFDDISSALDVDWSYCWPET